MPESAPPPAHKTRAPRKAARLDDPRSVRSRALLKAALLRLIDANAFEKITLRDITVQAGVSYPTVFNHYDSKEALFQDLARGEISALLQAFFERNLLPEWRPGQGMCRHVARRRSLWRTLLTAGASDVMRAEFIRRGREMAADRPILPHGFPFDLVSGVIASGTFEIFAWWLGRDPDLPMSEVANMLETLVIEPGLGLRPGYFTTRAGLPEPDGSDP